MKIVQDMRQNPWNTNAAATQPKTDNTKTKEPANPWEEMAATLELSEKARKAKESEMWGGIQKEAAAKETSFNPKSKPQDASGGLTRRLVAAKAADEIRTILSEAYKNLSEFYLIAMNGDGEEVREALTAIKRLHKLINRAGRKIGDLNAENELRVRQKRAEKNAEKELVRELTAELEQRLAERKRREQKYLKDVKPEETQSKQAIEGMTRAEMEAKVMLLAQAMAQMSVSQVVATSAPEGGTVGGEVSAGGEAAASGGEVSAGGGEVAVSAG